MSEFEDQLDGAEKEKVTKLVRDIRELALKGPKLHPLAYERRAAENSPLQPIVRLLLRSRSTKVSNNLSAMLVSCLLIFTIC